MSEESLEKELEAKQAELRSLETLQLPHPDAKDDLDWLNDNFALLSHDQQARVLNAISAARQYVEMTS